MIDNCYTFKELKEKFHWTGGENGGIESQIRYAKRRGVNIEKAFKKGPTYFKILDLQNFPDEVWKDVEPNLNTNCEVSNYGRIRDKKFQAFIGREDKDGYVEICKNNKYYRVHRLVMMAFNPISNPENYSVDHINGIRNDNRVSNLRWVLQSENTQLMAKNNIEMREIIAQLVQKYGYEETKNKLSSLL